MAAPISGSSGLCVECHNGLHFDKYNFFCLYCQRGLCVSCKSKHPASHASGFRRAIDRVFGWTPLDADKKECIVCKQERYGRVECANTECDRMMCLFCWNEHGHVWLGHDEHKSLRWFNVPGGDCLWKIDDTCMSCEVGASHSHCARCAEGMFRLLTAVV
jgi:hypothetical protein